MVQQEENCGGKDTRYENNYANFKQKEKKLWETFLFMTI